MNQIAEELCATVDGAVAHLRAVPDAVNRRRPGTGKWSPREIIGHLIGSAANNHQRFVRAQFQENAATLAYFVHDYVEHLRHHLAQITAMVGD